MPAVTERNQTLLALAGRDRPTRCVGSPVLHRLFHVHRVAAGVGEVEAAGGPVFFLEGAGDGDAARLDFGVEGVDVADGEAQVTGAGARPDGAPLVEDEVDFD